MKTLFTVQTHSFVDLITNSSTELFVCDAKKTVNAVKEVLQELLNTHNKLTGENHTFKSCFGDIFVSPFSFDYYKVPQNIRNEFENFCEHGNPFHREYGLSSAEWTSEYKQLRDKEFQLGRSMNIYERDLEARDPAEYERRWKQYQKSQDEIWYDFYIRKAENELQMFYEFLTQNGYKAKTINSLKKSFDKQLAKQRAEKVRWVRFEKIKDKKLQDAFDKFQTYLDYGMSIPKGAVMIYSADDNSIPYTMFDSISSYLNAHRWHLG